VAHVCNPSIQRLREEDLEFQASLGHIVRPCFKKQNPKQINKNPKRYVLHGARVLPVQLA
jgi:hypothetical protein